MRTGPAALLGLSLAAAAASPAARVSGGEPARESPASLLEQLLATSVGGELVAAPRGRAVAWVMNDRGRRNVWVATGEPLRARMVTAFAVDDGQPIQELAWAPDGLALAFTRGPGSGASGPTLNPASQVAGVSQDVWITPVDGRPARLVGPGHAPAVSTRGQVAFVRDEEIWTVPVASAVGAQRLVKPHGQVSDLQWSPDGSALAFLARRGAHSLLGILHDGHPSLEYVSPSVDRDMYPRWSPDGRSIAFARFENADSKMRSSGRWGPIDSAWSLMVVDRAGAGVPFGTAREVWRAPPRPIGSFPRNLQMLRWVEGGRLLFASEHEDWAHLYLADPMTPGGAPILLTPGECEVDDAASSADGHTLFFSSNCGDLERRHLWTVSIPARGAAARPPQPLTGGASVETAPAPTADGRTLVFLRADARTPTAPKALTLADGGVASLTPGVPPSFPSRALIEPERASFKAPDGQEVHGALFASAAGPGAARRPALIHVHGGPTAGQDLLGWNPFFQYLASRGFVVLGLNYRGGAGYGRPFREFANQGTNGAGEYQDVLAAAEYLRSRPDVDPARIGIFGASYGGYLTQLSLARNSDVFAAGVTECGIYDMSNNPRGSVPRAGEAGRVALESSAVASIDKWRSPVLVIHGDDDPGVDFDQQTITLVKALRARKVPVEQLVFPDEGHGSSVWAHVVRARQATSDFFDRQLAPAAPGK